MQCREGVELGETGKKVKGGKDVREQESKQKHNNHNYSQRDPAAPAIPARVIAVVGGVVSVAAIEVLVNGVQHSNASIILIREKGDSLISLLNRISLKVIGGHLEVVAIWYFSVSLDSKTTKTM
jgi:hypothetical protein